GNNDVTSLGLGSTLAMTGTNEEANLSNGTVWLGANTTLTGTGLTGSNDTLGGSASDSVVEYGNNDVTSLGLG
ncbi:hypothetical protein, partial [Pseudomonas sp. 10S4]|uniref:hypothetical protein n=1 Tax=Pseudomonas sp. 10S4 TaxID=3048583 RepID=UPI002B2347CB